SNTRRSHHSASDAAARRRRRQTMTSASIAQVASATAALCGAAGVTYYAVNVAKVFGGALGGRVATRTSASGRSRGSRARRAPESRWRLDARERAREASRGVERGRSTDGD
ncbi:hypothetical protein N9D08_01930, partial [bacterium]|nr:hypothetical protein [bacterium]